MWRGEEEEDGWEEATGEHHSGLTQDSVVADFRHCSVACRGTAAAAAAPGTYDLFQLCSSDGDDPATGRVHLSSFNSALAFLLFWLLYILQSNMTLPCTSVF